MAARPWASAGNSTARATGSLASSAVIGTAADAVYRLGTPIGTSRPPHLSIASVSSTCP